MQAFLRIADSMEESDPELNVWVKQVRDAADHTEHILDKFMLNLASRQGHGFSSFVHKIGTSITNLKADHQLAVEIQGIKSRVCEISEGHKRYHYRYYAHERGLSSSAASNTWQDLRADALLIEEAELVGINKRKRELIERLVEGEGELVVVSVVGMGGLGKTTLVKKVYDDHEVKKHFPNHAWINVSQSFKIEDLIRDMIEQLYGKMKQPIPQGVDTMSSQSLNEMVKDFLQHQRYVIVLDDIWNIAVWEAVKRSMPNSNCGSRILITTRFANIAAALSVNSNIYYLQPLSPEESWTLFCKKVFQDNFCPSHLKDISQQILKRCEGLPLAIVAIGGIQSSKDKSKTLEWELISRSLGAELESNESLKNVTKILSLSYYDLPYYLKCCFLYLSIFPEDDLIEPMRLIRLWIAEGFVEGKQGRTLEEVAECYLNELTNRGVVQIAETTTGGRVRKCRVHDLLGENIVSKSRDLNFANVISENKTVLREKVRRLSLHNTCNNTLPKKSSPHLRSLFTFGGSLSNSSIRSFLGSAKLLKVLDLRGAPIDQFPDEVVNLFHLRYLSLRSTMVDKLPRSIDKLQNLETLDLKYTNVCKLPVQILKLKQLRHLLVYRYLEITSFVPFGAKQGFDAPLGIGSLTSLQKLSCIRADQGGSITRELASLSQLRRLGIKGLRKEDGKFLCSSIEKMKNLRSLDVTSVSEMEFIDIDSISSPPPLQHLYIEGRLGTIPDWFCSLHNLARLRLGWSKLQMDPLDALNDLPNLVELELYHAYYGEELSFKAGGFQKLKILWLGNLKKLASVLLDKGTMPSLQNLSFDRCKRLEIVPSGIHYLSNLKLLQFYGMSERLASRLLPHGHGEDHWIVEHIPEVYFR